MNYYAFSALFVMAVSLIMGLFILFRNKKGQVNGSFFIFAFFIALWSFGYFFWQLSSNPESALLWTRVLMAGAIFIPVAYLNLAYILIGLTNKRRKIIFGSYLLFLIFFILDFTPLFINKIESNSFFPYWPMPGFAFHPFLVLWLSYMIYGTYFLFKTSLKQSGIIRDRLQWTAIGVLLGIIGGSTNYFLWYGIQIPPVLSILSSFYVFAIAYIILMGKVKSD